MKVYEKVYDFYINQMESGGLKPGDKMPSLRECERVLGVSRTSVETAYMQLAADGYIYSVEKVGYYVSDTFTRHKNKSEFENIDWSKNQIYKKETKYKYDLATIGEDKEVSCLDLWRRYMKSALRQEDRLLSYANNQGEPDLREEIAKYVRKNRNIICSPEEIVIGAGFQNLLQILIALIPGEKTISFPTRDFTDGATTFENAGFQVSYRNKESHVIYVAPSYMTKWGDVMPMKRRRELVEHSLKNDHLIIEDDYQNEFVFSGKATPSLYALTGGENTAFLGSFSRVLLPSVRISYLILPKRTLEKYNTIRDFYNQTASKAEQIALTQFLRDGHLSRHIKRMRRLYGDKRQVMESAIRKHLRKSEIMLGDSGMEIGVVLTGENLVQKIKEIGLSVIFLQVEKDRVLMLLSCSRIPEEEIDLAIETLGKISKK